MALTATALVEDHPQLAAACGLRGDEYAQVSAPSARLNLVQRTLVGWGLPQLAALLGIDATRPAVVEAYDELLALPAQSLWSRRASCPRPPE